MQLRKLFPDTYSFVAGIAGFLVIILAVVVIIGWLTHTQALVQIVPTFAPVQFNTALCFLLTGAALISLAFNRKRVAAALGFLVLSFAVLTLLQYWWNVNFGIDTALFEPWTVARTSHPGRMSPLTAICFSVSNLSVLFVSLSQVLKLREYWPGIPAAFVFAQSFIAILGYMTGIQGTYSWGNLTRMALITAFCFFTVSIGLLACAAKPRSVESSKQLWIPLSIGAMLVALIAMWSGNSFHGMTAAANARFHSTQVLSNLSKAKHELDKEIDSSAQKPNQLNLSHIKESIRTVTANLAALRAFTSNNDTLGALFSKLDQISRRFGDYTNFEALLQREADSTTGRYAEMSALLSELEIEVQNQIKVQTEILNSGAQDSDRLTTLGALFGLMFFSYSAWLASNEISRRKRSESILSDTSRLQDAVLNATSYSIVSTNEAGVIRTFNRGAEQMLGFDAKDVLGKSTADLWVCDDSANGVSSSESAGGLKPLLLELMNLAEDGGKIERETTLKRKDGTLFPALISFSAIFDAEKRITGYLKVISDITERKREEENLIRINKNLENQTRLSNAYAADAARANEAKSEFLANMSHEIRTPLNGILGMTGVLMDSTLTPEQRRSAEIVQTCSENLLVLINDILDFSKIEAGKLDLEIIDFSLQDLLDDVVSVVGLKVAEKKLQLICSLDPSAPRDLRGDPSRLRQILINLVGNAVKFTSAGSVTVHVSEIKSPKQGVCLRFSVRDTGIGIPADRLDTLFKSFSQVDTSTSRKYGGTGLGLAISKKLAQMMGGEMGVESAVGKGSEFWFTADFTLPADAKKESGITPKFRGARALIVDSSAENRSQISSQFRQWGMLPVAAPDGLTALQCLDQAYRQKEPIQIVFIDVRLPGMDGIALAKSISADQRFTGSIAMMPNIGSAEDAKLLKEANLSHSVTKPIRVSNLIECLSQIMLANSERRLKSEKLSVNQLEKAKRKAGMRILLADDVVVNQVVAQSMLSKLGCRADLVANGIEAIKALEMVSYDLVLMDVQMPELDGLDATRQIRDNKSKVLNHNVPVIAMTASAMRSDQDACISAGMNDFITKPVKLQSLTEVLERYLPNEATTKPQATAALH